MTPIELFSRLAEPLPRLIEEQWNGQRNLCVLATRVALDVAAYFQIEAQAQPVRTLLYNAAYAAHIARGEEPDVRSWAPLDGSHSVGIGFETPTAEWAGHLIAVADDIFGDFSIRQGERIEKGIITGPAIVGPRKPGGWTCINESGTTIQYRQIESDGYRQAPDWRDAKRRRRVVGDLIRLVR